MANINKLTSSLASLKQDGYCVIDNFLDDPEIDILTAEFDSLFDQIPNQAQGYLESSRIRSEENGYLPGKHLVAPPNSYHSSLPELIKIFGSPQIRGLVEGYCGSSSNFLMQTFLSTNINR